MRGTRRYVEARGDQDRLKNAKVQNLNLLIASTSRMSNIDHKTIERMWLAELQVQTLFIQKSLFELLLQSEMKKK